MVETGSVTEERAAEIAANRELWAIVNERYTDAAAESMWRRAGMAWGLFAVPEEQLGVLGDVRGLDVLDLACGTGYVAAWLARAGARPVALDFSGDQLGTAQRLQAQLGPDFPLIQGDAERAPLASGQFDLIVSEGGVAQDRLLRGQREVHLVQWPGGGFEFHPSHGEWIRQLRGSGFVVEAMHELYAPADGLDHPFYEIVSPEWATAWPAEELWVASLAVDARHP